ncbi:MAG: hypothetical protein AAF432_01940 [Planctomycetota bacterium]
MNRPISSSRHNGLAVTATTLAALLAMTSAATMAVTVRGLGGSGTSADPTVRAVAAAMAAMAREWFAADSVHAETHATTPDLTTSDSTVVLSPGTARRDAQRHLSERLLDLPPPALRV